MKLQEILSDIGSDSIDLQEIIQKKYPYLDVGEIQPTYNSLINSISQYKKLKEDANYSYQLRINQSRMNNYERLIEEKNQQIQLTKSEIKLLQKNYDRHIQLHKKEVISTKDLEEKELELIRAKSNLDNLESVVLQMNSEKSQILKENKNLLRSEHEDVIQLELKIFEALRNTTLSFNRWEEKFVLKAPIHGRVVFFDFWSQNQFVKIGDKVFTVVPLKDQKIMGICKMGLANSGKVAIHQKVNIKLNAYPYKEFGILKGKVSTISEVPNKEYYVLTIDFPDNLVTSFNKRIDFKQELTGIAEIITEDLTIAERIFYRFREIFNR